MDDLVQRKSITQALVRRCGKRAQIIIGIAPDTIVWACWVGEALELPVAYVRSEAKKYGAGRIVEGGSTKGLRAVLITDGHDVDAYTPHLEAKSIKVIDLSLLPHTPTGGRRDKRGD